MKRPRKGDVLPKRTESMFPEWQRGLNEEQLAAVMHGEGPARVDAPAGSGKTHTLVSRIARLVDSGVDPSRILAITFTKKAADEMAERVKRLGIRGARIGTWHSVCLQILREDRTEWAGWETRESTKLELKDVLGFREMKWDQADVNAIASYIGRCKANLYDPGSPEALELAGRLVGQFQAGRANEAFQRYNDKLAEKEILSFDDYLVNVAKHFEDEHSRAHWAAKWDYLIQDEVQDENGAQHHLARELARDHRNYMVVGDVFQSIYSWRGSSPGFLAAFEQEWEGASTFWLPKNYRSGRKIIDAANGIIMRAAITNVEPREMVAARDFDGKVTTHVAEDFDDEAKSFAAWVQEGVRAGDAEYSDYCALFRVNAQSRALEEGLIAARIPYVVVGGVSFYERREVRDLLAYLRIGAGRGELEDVKRCINAPFRFLAKAFVGRVTERVEILAEDGVQGSMVEWGNLVRDVADGERIQARQKSSAEEWAAIIAEVAAKVDLGMSHPGHEESRPSAVLEEIIRRTRYIDWIKREEGEESIETSGGANVRELVRVASKFGTVGELLDYVAETISASKKQRDDKQAGGERVLLMNSYRAKGLEWPHVWVAGFNEMIFPHPKGDPEEERRVAYVTTTRARDTMVLSHVRTMATRAGIKDAEPSRFIADAGLDGPGHLSFHDSEDRSAVDQPIT